MHLHRRQFLSGIGAMAGVALAGCGLPEERKPRLIATGRADWLTLGGDSLFWIVGGSVHRWRLAGGPPEQVHAEAEGFIDALATDGKELYFAKNRELNVVTLGAPGARVLTGYPGRLKQLVVQSDAVYFNAYEEGSSLLGTRPSARLGAIGRADGKVQIVASGSDEMSMAVDTDALWYLQRGLKRLPKGSTTPEEIPSSGLYKLQAVDERAVYGGGQQQIQRFDKTTHKVTAIASSAYSSIYALAIGADRAWFSLSGELWCVPRDGSGSPMRWTSSVSDSPGEHSGPRDPLVVRDTVYFLADNAVWSVGV